VESLPAWHDLNLMLGGAAATLVGLLFVAASLHLDILADPGHAHLRTLALHTLLEYLFLLILAVCLLIPDQSELRLGVELMILGAAGLVWLPIFVVRVAGRRAGPGPAGHEWLRTFVAWGGTAAGLTGIGAAVAVGMATALAWLPLIDVALLLGAVLTSWDLLLRVRARPRDQADDQARVRAGP
jgi:hypothetical protein